MLVIAGIGKDKMVGLFGGFSNHLYGTFEQKVLHGELYRKVVDEDQEIEVVIISCEEYDRLTDGN